MTSTYGVMELNSAYSQSPCGDSVNSGLTTETQSMAILNKPVTFTSKEGQNFTAAYKDFMTKDKAWSQQGVKAERALEEQPKMPKDTQ